MSIGWLLLCLFVTVLQDVRLCHSLSGMLAAAIQASVLWTQSCREGPSIQSQAARHPHRLYLTSQQARKPRKAASPCTADASMPMLRLKHKRKGALAGQPPKPSHSLSWSQTEHLQNLKSFSVHRETSGSR